MRGTEQMNGQRGDPAVHWTSEIPNALWLRTWRLGEWLNGPLSPLFRTFLVPVLVEARERAGTGRLGQRLPRMWRVKTPAYCVVNGYFFARAEPSLPSVMLLPIRFLVSEAFGGWTNRWQSRALPLFLKRLADYQAIDVENTPTSLLLRYLSALALDVAECWYAIGLASGGTVPLKRFLAGILKNDFPDVDILVLLRGGQSQMIRGQCELYELAQSAQRAGLLEHPNWTERLRELLRAEAVPEDLAPFHSRLTSALANIGHQTDTLDLSQPCLSESPADLVLAIGVYGRKHARNPQIALRKSVMERERATSRIRSQLSSRKCKIFDRLLVRLHSYEQVLANTSFEMQRGWPILRRFILELGSRLCREGKLDDPESVFFLTRDDIVSALNGKVSSTPLATTARENRALWQSRGRLHPPRCIPPPGDPAWRQAMTWPINLRAICGERSENDWTLRGIAASPGQQTGRARVCLTLEDAAAMRDSEILVAPSTTPNWTPLFSQVAAIVTDVGAATSHSSIIAREFRIPAVVGTQQATQVIRSGDHITVDGTAGLVHLELQAL